MLTYYADIFLTNEIEAWFLVQGAQVIPSPNNPLLVKGRWVSPDPDVYFSGRKIHFYSDAISSAGATKMARIFFNDETKGTLLLLMVKWPSAIIRHSIPKEFA